MRNITTTIALTAAFLIAAGGAHAGNMDGYNMTRTTTETIGVVTLQPTETTATEPQVGEIIYHTQPYTGETAVTTQTYSESYVTGADGTVTYTGDTVIIGN